MDFHNIHDEKIAFTSLGDEARSFLKGGMSKESLVGYTKTASEKGMVKFTNPNGKKFIMHHVPGQGANDKGTYKVDLDY